MRCPHYRGATPWARACAAARAIALVSVVTAAAPSSTHAAAGAADATSAAAATATTSAFPFLFDVGGINNATLNASEWSAVSSAVPRVQFGAIFECPHPCGLLPSYDAATGVATNGGIPQLANLTLHLDTLRATFDKYVAAADTRWIDLDFESWNPVWGRNPPAPAGYTQNASIALARQQHPTWTNATQIEAQAKADYEAAAVALLVKTIQYVRSIRPGLKIGLYGFPTRYYWQGYNSTDGDALRLENDQLFGIWCNLDGLFPSVYQFYDSCNTTDPSVRRNNEQYVTSNVAEAVRIAEEVPSKCSSRTAAPPVWAYTWELYHDGVHTLCDADLQMGWQLSQAAGAAGTVMWGYRPTVPARQEFVSWYLSDFTPLVNAWTPPLAADTAAGAAEAAAAAGGQPHPAVAAPASTGAAQGVDDGSTASPLSSVYPVVDVPLSDAASPYAMGRYVGTAMAHRIRSALADPQGAVASWLLPWATSTKEGREATAQLWAAAQTFDAGFAEEVMGIADGAGVDRQTVIVANLQSELEMIAPPPPSPLGLATRWGSRHVDRCSDVLVPGGGTAGVAGSERSPAAVVAHNEDGEAPDVPFAYIVRTSSAGEEAATPSFVSFVYAGQLEGYAWAANEAGLFMSVNALFPHAVNTSGVPSALLLRRVLLSQSVDEALGRATMPGQAFGFSLNIGVAGNATLWNVETHASGSSVKVLLPGDDTYVHFNQYRHMTPPGGQAADPSSDHRLARFDELSSSAPVATTAAARRVLGDTADKDFPLYRNGAAPDNAVTLSTVVFDAEARTATVFERRNPWNATATMTIAF